MSHSSSLFRAGGLALCMLGASCVSTRVEPHAVGHGLEDDERRLWSRSAEEQARLNRSGFRANLPEAEARLDAIIARLHPPALPENQPYRAHILVNPTLNAFAYPNGVIYVHTGLLARLENDAQLAVILAHELTHTTHRHGLRGQRKAQNATAFLATFTVATAGLGSLLGGVGTLAAISGYSQDLEREADRAGFDLMLAAGYDPREAPRTFVLLRKEALRNQAKEPFFFGSHPRLTERIESFDTLLASLPAERLRGDADAAGYAKAFVEAFQLNAQAALYAGDYDQVSDSVARVLSLKPGDPAARLMLAEAQRKRNRDGDLAAARTALEALTRESPDLALAWRELGLVLLRQGEPAPAADYFKRYLALAPDAPDRAYLETYLKP